MNLDKYRGLFIEECREHLQGLNKGLLRMEEQGAEFDGMDELFREAHSIKGMSGSMGYESMASLSHAMEDLFDRVRKGTSRITPELMSLLFRAIDALGQMNDEVEEKGTPEFDARPLTGELRKAAEGAAPKEAAEEEAAEEVPEKGPDEDPEDSPEDVLEQALEASLSEEEDEQEEKEAAEAATQTIISAEDDGYVEIVEDLDEVREELEKVAEGIEAALAEGDPPGERAVEEKRESEAEAGREPPLRAGREELEKMRVLSAAGGRPLYLRIPLAHDVSSPAARNFVVLGKLAKAGDLILSRPPLAEVMQGEGRELIEAFLVTAKSDEEIAALLRAVPELGEFTIGPVPAGGGEAAAPALPIALPQAPSPPAPPQAPPATPRDDARRIIDKYLPSKSTSVRVDTRVLDALINLVGEMIINRDRLLEVTQESEDEELQVALNRLDLLVGEFQDSIMAVRMMPIELITDRLPRAVRDLARQGDKDVHFEVLGKGIEVDRAILEEMNDVLIHLVRNAIDHGIETVEERKALGKKAKGKLRIIAGREREWVWVTIEDDGRGMDAATILEKAVECGKVSAESAAALSEEETLMLTCLPGLSTAGKVTGVSGRGVGMDVVKSKVESFGGSVQIRSTAGEGTAITLRVPLTLAIIRILLVELGGQIFGLPLAHITHTLQLEAAQIEWSQKRPLLRLERGVVALTDLGSLIGVEGRGVEGRETVAVVLTETGGKMRGIAVDGFLGTLDAVIKPLGPPLKKIRGLAGATILGDGRTVLVIDLAAIA